MLTDLHEYSLLQIIMCFLYLYFLAVIIIKIMQCLAHVKKILQGIFVDV